MTLRSKFLALVAAFILVAAGTAWGLSAFNDEYISGNWTFQNDVTFLGDIAGASITLNGVSYTWPAADGTNGYQLTTDGSGTLSWAAAGASCPWDDLANPDNNKALDFTTYYTSMDFGDDNHDMLTIQGTAAFGDVSIVKIEQVTGDPTDGTVLEVVSADTDADALLVTANSINSILVAGSGNVTITGGTGVINYTDFDVSADGAVTIASDTDNTMITLNPSIATTLAIDATAANIATALSVGANDIVGTTGLINYTNFDVDASGNVAAVGGTFTGNISAVDGTFSGDVTVTGTFQQDAIEPASGPNHNLNIDAAGSGEVILAATSTGNIVLTDDIVVSDTYNMTIGEGSLTIDDDANETALTVDSDVTSGTAVAVVADATNGTGLSVTCDSLTSGAVLYLDATDATLTGYYIQAYDGGANDFAVKRYGEVEIAGSAGSDMLTITAGDVELTAGDIDANDGVIEVNTDEDEDSYIERAQATVTTPVFSVVEQTDTVASGKAALFVDQDTDSTPSSAIEVDTEGAYVMKVDALIAAGDGIYVDVADSYVGQWLIVDAGPWLGTASEGFWQFTSDADTTTEVGGVIKINLRGTGTPGTAIDGHGLWITEEAGAKANQSLIFLDSKNNNAIRIFNEGTTADGIKFDVADSYTGQGILVDAGPWVGTVNEGFFQFTSDSGAVAETGQVIRINLQGTSADAAGISGKAIYAKDTAAATAGSYLAHFESTNNGALYTKGDIDISNSWLVGASPIVLEGNTDDAYEVTLAVEDPTADTTQTIPAAPASGDIPSILSQGSTQTSQAGSGTADVTGSTVTLPDSYMTAGKTVTWIVAGTKTGANAAMIVHLYLKDAAVMSLTASDAAAVDWIARFTLHEHTDTANQDIVGELLCNGKVVVTDYATATKDLTGGAITAKLQIQSQNAGDTVTAEYVRADFAN